MVLNRDPMHMSEPNIVCIQVLQTIRGGEQVYPRKGKTPLYRDRSGGGEAGYDKCVKALPPLAPTE